MCSTGCAHCWEARPRWRRLWFSRARKLSSQRRSGLAAVAGSWAYVLGIGAPYAAVRAVAMLTLTLAGRLLGRPTDPLGVLAGAALVMVVGTPGAILDIGFQLSFAAV